MPKTTDTRARVRASHAHAHSGTRSNTLAQTLVCARARAKAGTQPRDCFETPTRARNSTIDRAHSRDRPCAQASACALCP